LQPMSEDDLTARLARAVPADVTLVPPAPAVGFVHRRLPDADVYFLANSGNTPLAVSARFRAATPHAERWDPLTGRVEPLPVRGGEIPLELEPYGSRVVVFRKGDATPASKTRAASASEELRSGW